MIEHFDVRRSLSVSQILGSDVLKALDRSALERSAQELKGRFYAVGIDVSLFTRDVDGSVRREAEVSFVYDHLRIHLVYGADLSARRFDLAERYSALGLAVLDARSEKGVFPEFSHEGIASSLGCIQAGVERLLRPYQQMAGFECVSDEFSC